MRNQKSSPSVPRRLLSHQSRITATRTGLAIVASQKGRRPRHRRIVDDDADLDSGDRSGDGFLLAVLFGPGGCPRLVSALCVRRDGDLPGADP